jgi:Ca2+-binding EF-hand superfamily protein
MFAGVRARAPRPWLKLRGMTLVRFFAWLDSASAVDTRSARVGLVWSTVLHCGLVGAALASLPLQSSAANLASDPQQQLQRMDSDGDGRISLGEYRAWMSRGFRAMDANGDGVLQPHELPPGTSFRRRMALSLDEHHAQLDARFRLQDVDSSGHLDVRELAAPPQTGR